VTPQSSTGIAGNSQTIARNSFWYGLELLYGLLAAFLVGIVVARIIGPQRLGPYNYILWLTNVTATAGAFGLPMTTRKYMAEYLNRAESGVARSIYRTTLRVQMWIAAAVTAIAVLLVYTVANPEQRLFSLLLALNMAPRMVGFIPSQANNAAEVMRRNTVPSLLGGILVAALTLFSLWRGWDLPGIALAGLAGTSLETVLKLYSVKTWLPDTVPRRIPSGLAKQMFLYSWQGLILMLLNIVVWDRSDVIFLKALNSDIRQITFFTMAFNWTERVLLLPSAFVNSMGATLMAQYGRGAERLRPLTVEGTRYVLLIALPLLAGLACVTGRVVPLILGEPYRLMIPVLTIVTVMAIPKALIAPPMLLLQTTENQGFLVIWLAICGAIDMSLDLLLVPRYGAVGAALANGTAQTIAALGVWLRAHQLFRLDLRLSTFARIALCGLGMSATTVIIRRAIPSYLGLAVSIVSGALVWFALLRWTGALDQRDGQRFLDIGRALPSGVRPLWEMVVGLLLPGGVRSANARTLQRD